MNEKLAELMDTVQKTAVQAADVAADAAYGVGKKAGELLSVAKLRIRIATLEGSVEECLTELGGMLYATHTGDPTDSETLLVKLQEIDGLKAEIAALNAQLGREREARTCATCGATVKDGDAFCRECGEKL